MARTTLVLAIIALAWLQLTTAKPTGKDHPHGGPPGLEKKELRLPPGQTKEKLRKFHGMEEKDFESMKTNIKQAKRELLEAFRQKKMNESEAAAFMETVDEFIGDVVYTKEQSEFFLERMHKKFESGRRQKRKSRDFAKFPNSKWPVDAAGDTIIRYKFDGNHDDTAMTAIRKAIAHWEANTCVQFLELAADAEYPGNYIIFQNENEGCWSYIGRVNIIPQPINLQSAGCLYALGTAIHEVGHALGLYHEHVRPDRDEHVTVNLANVQEGKLSNFEIETENIDSKGVEYDYGSVMHYTTGAFSIDKTSLNTIEAKNPLYKMTMGQRTGLSFFDIKLTNILYCAESCPSLACINGGLVDPNDCTVCQCPNGYSGALCDEIATSDATCPTPHGVIEVTSDVEQCITMSSYEDYTQCNWKLQAASGCNIEMSFSQDSDFGIFCNSETTEPTCYHWVEIMYQGSLATRGPRFCCYDTPSDVLTSEGNEAVVTFRSDFPAGWEGWRKGFKLCYKLSDAQCLTTTTTTTTTEPTTTSTTTEPTTTSTTTEPTTTSTTTEPTTTSTTTEPTTTSTTTEPTTTSTTTEPTTTSTTTEPTTTSTTTEPTSTSTTTESTTTSTTTEPTTTSTTTESTTTSTTTEPTTTSTTTEPTTTSTTTEPTTTSTTTEPTTTSATTEPTTTGATSTEGSKESESSSESEASKEDSSSESRKSESDESEDKDSENGGVSVGKSAKSEKPKRGGGRRWWRRS